MATTGQARKPAGGSCTRSRACLSYLTRFTQFLTPAPGITPHINYQVLTSGCASRRTPMETKSNLIFLHFLPMCEKAVSSLTWKELRSHHSHPYNKKNAEQTTSTTLHRFMRANCFPENWRDRLGDTEDHSFLLSNAQKQKPTQEIVPAGTGALVAKNGNFKNPGGPGLRCGSVPSLL